MRMASCEFLALGYTVLKRKLQVDSDILSNSFTPLDSYYYNNDMLVIAANPYYLKFMS